MIADVNTEGVAGGGFAKASLAGIVLSYHRIASAEFDPWGLRVAPKIFAQQLSMLREFGEPISLPEFVRSCKSYDGLKPAIVVTFDDGYVDNVAEALPLLKQFDIPATIFVSTGYIGKPYFWWDALEHVFLRPNRLPPELNLQCGSTVLSRELGGAALYSHEQYASDCRSCTWRGAAGSRVRLYHEVYEALWSLQHEIRLNLIADIISWAGMEALSFRDARPMTADEVVRLGTDNLVTIGDHSVNHLPLDEMPPSVQEFEIVDSRVRLEELLGCHVDTFAYPHGKYADKTIEILRSFGFTCACTTHERIVTAATDSMLLPRVTVKNWDAAEFRIRLTKWLSG